jgi:hypothetical protein
VNTKLLDHVPENKIRVRMSLMPEKMRAILEKRYQSYNKKSSVPEKLFQAGYHAHQFQSTIYHDKKLSSTKNSSTSLTTKYQRSLKTSWSRMYFPYTRLHKINLKKAFKARRRNTWTLENQEQKNQSVWRLKTTTCKASLIRAYKVETKTSTYLLGIYFKEDPSSKDVQINCRWPSTCGFV